MPNTTTQTVKLPYLQEPATITTFEDGYTLVFVPKKGDVFNVSTWVRTGSIHEDAKINGISHFLEHLLFKGTQRFGPGEFDKKMEAMGAVINAATWKDFTFYYVTGPKGQGNGKTDSENFDLALDMHADMMLHSTIPESEVGQPYDPFDPNYTGEKRERSVVIEEIGMREDQPWTKVYNSVNQMMYPDGHPYQRDVIGTRQIIGEIPQQTIVDYYRRWYSPQMMTTIVVGDFNAAKLTEKVRRHFDFSDVPPPTKSKNVVINNKTALDGLRYEEVKGDYQTMFFIMGWHGPDPKNLTETIALDIFNHVLGESRNARMTQALIEKPAKPIFNMIGSGQSTYKLGNAFYIQGNFNSTDIAGALQQVTDELVKLLTTEPVKPEEFQRAIKKLRVNFAETSENASGIAETIGESLTVIGDLSHYVDYLHALETIDLGTVQKTAQQYLDPKLVYTSVLVPNA